jgi:bacillithiol biosynthesis deacetylase BshB1
MTTTTTMTTMPMLDVLAFGAHPDDCEFFMAGTLLHLKSLSYRVGVCDLTRGEAGTYGDTETRKVELERATAIMGLDVRETLDFQDGSIRDSEENRRQIIEIIRKYQPEVVFSFADCYLRHPDHTHCGRMVRECCFLAGIQKIETASPVFRPSAFIGFPELVFTDPDFVVDVSAVWEKRLEAIRCFHSQVLQTGEDARQAKTFIRSQSFWDMQEARGTMAGAMIGVRYGEPFYSELPPKINDPLQAFQKNLNWQGRRKNTK